jgi:signal transduction histidine kinase
MIAMGKTVATRDENTIESEGPGGIERRVRPARRSVDSAPIAESLSTIAHELRTPLTTLRVSLELLSDWRDLPPDEVDELLARVERGTLWLESLTDNLAAWSAAEVDALTLRREPGPISDWLLSALLLVQPLLDRRDQGTILDCPTPVPWVDGDPVRLGQALVNLLINAGKYSVWGDRLVVQVTVDAGTVRVSVTDHGDGVRPEERQRIFWRRARGRAALQSGARGHGLGLDVVRGIAEAHGGAVGIDGVYGQGATFWFALPLLRGHSGESDEDSAG